MRGNPELPQDEPAADNFTGAAPPLFSAAPYPAPATVPARASRSKQHASFLNASAILDFPLVEPLSSRAIRAALSEKFISINCSGRKREYVLAPVPPVPLVIGSRSFQKGPAPQSGSGRVHPLFPTPIVNFITSRSGSDYMHDVVSSRKMENGIVVFWEEKSEKVYESFNYAELIDMNINALDLLERPKSYKVDKGAHKLIVEK
jgi:hypothetical protein